MSRTASKIGKTQCVEANEEGKRILLLEGLNGTDTEMGDVHRWVQFLLRNQALPEDTPIYLSWCDFGALANEIIGSRGSLTRIKYFTAPVGDLGAIGEEEGGEKGRKKRWLRAVRTISNLEVVEGFHNREFSTNPSQRQKYRSEKATDVNIAIALVLDAAKGVYDSAILVTGDCDQMPAVHAASTEFARHIEVWLPPGQPKGRWSAFNGNRFVNMQAITPDMLERVRLPDSITHSGGTIQAPKMWRK